MSNSSIKAVWDVEAKSDLKDIYTFNKDIFSLEFAKKVRSEILQSVSDLKFTKQWSYDTIIGEPYRRIIVRHYSIVYLEKTDKLIYILRVFDSRQDPKKLKDSLK